MNDVELPQPQPAPAQSNGHSEVATNNQPAPTLPAQEQTGNIGEIDRIRDIIFGGQQRDMERRFKNLERRAESLTNDLQDFQARHDQERTEIDSRFRILEEQLHQEIQALDNRLQTARRENQDRFAALERQMADRLARLEKSLTDQLDSLGETKLNQLDMGDLLIEAGMRLRKEKFTQG